MVELQPLTLRTVSDPGLKPGFSGFSRVFSGGEGGPLNRGPRSFQNHLP